MPFFRFFEIAVYRYPPVGCLSRLGATLHILSQAFTQTLQRYDGSLSSCAIRISLNLPPQDVIPPYGLSFYKPSTLWPPPPEDMTDVVRESLRSRIRQAVTATTASLSTYANRQHSGSASRSNSQSRPPSPAVSHDLRLQTGQTLHLGSTASLPIAQAGGRDQTVSCVTKDGEVLSIHQQIHLYTPNFMLPHPLISPVVSYLGGLPPLLVIAGDAEVLRDEIIYL